MIEDVVTNRVVEKTHQDRYDEFQPALERLINSHSMENGSDTPDFILAEYLTNCMKIWDNAIRNRNPHQLADVASWSMMGFQYCKDQRDKWYKPAPEEEEVIDCNGNPFMVLWEMLKYTFKDPYKTTKLNK